MKGKGDLGAVQGILDVWEVGAGSCPAPKGSSWDWESRNSMGVDTELEAGSFGVRTQLWVVLLLKKSPFITQTTVGWFSSPFLGKMGIFQREMQPLTLRSRDLSQSTPSRGTLIQPGEKSLPLPPLISGEIHAILLGLVPEKQQQKKSDFGTSSSRGRKGSPQTPAATAKHNKK